MCGFRLSSAYRSRRKAMATSPIVTTALARIAASPSHGRSGLDTGRACSSGSCGVVSRNQCLRGRGGIRRGWRRRIRRTGRPGGSLRLKGCSPSRANERHECGDCRACDGGGRRCGDDQRPPLMPRAITRPRLDPSLETWDVRAGWLALSRAPGLWRSAVRRRERHAPPNLSLSKLPSGRARHRPSGPGCASLCGATAFRRIACRAQHAPRIPPGSGRSPATAP